MAYRAHLQVYDPQTDRRVSPDAVLKTVRLGYAVKGTRTGRPGFWIEARSVEQFRFKVLDTTRLLAATCGFKVTVSATNGPSMDAIRKLGGSIPAGVTVNRG